MKKVIFLLLLVSYVALPQKTVSPDWVKARIKDSLDVIRASVATKQTASQVSGLITDSLTANSRGWQNAAGVGSIISDSIANNVQLSNIKANTSIYNDGVLLGTDGGDVIAIVKTDLPVSSATQDSLNTKASITQLSDSLNLKLNNTNPIVNNYMTFENNVSGPPNPGTNNRTYMYSDDGEMAVQDVSGNITIISPHPKEFDGKWMYMSERNGVYTVVDWELFISTMEKLTGKKFLYKGSLDEIKKEMR